ncbi:MAG TPA: serine/threonine-protein kinase, partial [Cryptosporangiaceae bacterium]|nr:serine/threonine-protein kinase [Cryptosporangiaceae bacterium]
MSRPLGSRYELSDLIATGATGEVWRATVRETGEPVAVKLLRERYAHDPEIVDCFLRERRLLAGLDHPAIVRVRDMVAEGDHLGIVMDLVHGQDLRHYLGGPRPMAPAAAAEVAMTVAEALAAAHAASVVHSDVKPANILVPSAGGPVKLADFGVARLTRRPGTLSHGTPEYVAPEVVTGHAAVYASDVYGLGTVLYEMLTGSTPYRGGTSEEVLRRHLERAPVWTPGVPEVLRPVLERCLDRDPASRPTAGALAEALRAVLP